MTKLSCGPLWKENNKWENVWFCYIISTTKIFFGPYIRLGEPTYGFWLMVLDVMVFGPWYFMLQHV